MDKEKESIEALNHASLERKNEIVSTWMTGQRVEGDEDLDIMFRLDDMWDEVYEENRIKLGFSNARLKANRKVLDYVYSTPISDKTGSDITVEDLILELKKDIYDCFVDVYGCNNDGAVDDANRTLERLENFIIKQDPK